MTGMEWEVLKRMLGTEHAQLCSTAIGILPRNELTRSANVDRQRHTAVVLRLGLFNQLYLLNNIMQRRFRGFRDPDPAVTRLNALLRHYVAGAPLVGPLEAGELAYKSEEEFNSVHSISVMQQAFVLLHELGHINAGLASEPNGNLNSEGGIFEAADFLADQWAAELFLRRSLGLDRLAPLRRETYLPSLFWLFEYWYLKTRACGLPAIPVRERWDRLRAHARSFGLHISESIVSVTRASTDLILGQ